MKRRPFCSVLIPCILVASLLLSACSEPPPPPERELRPVRSVIVEDARLERVRKFSGTSQSSQESRLSFKVSGTVLELPVQVGMQLTRGQLMARLDASQYQLEAQQSEASLVQARASETNARANYNRVKGLYENNNASRNDLDAARANSESASAQVDSAQKRLELARLNVSYTTLRAAADCTVASVDVELNENISPGTLVSTVNCGHALEVGISVAESLIGEIQEGLSATIRFNAIESQAFEGVVTEVGIASLAGTTFPVTVALAGEHPELRSGLAADVEFSIRRELESAAFVLPASAVLSNPDGTYVFLVEPGADGRGVLRSQAVTLGELSEQGIEILDGLSSGQRVVTAGVSKVRSGQEVLLGKGSP